MGGAAKPRGLDRKGHQLAGDGLEGFVVGQFPSDDRQVRRPDVLRTAFALVRVADLVERGALLGRVAILNAQRSRAHVAEPDDALFQRCDLILNGGQLGCCHGGSFSVYGSSVVLPCQ